MGNKYISELQRQALYLIQALLGVITPNFRMIWLTIDEEIVRIFIVLENKSKDDEEEIDDLKSEFEALQARSIKYSFDVKFSKENLIWPNEKAVVVYRKKED